MRRRRRRAALEDPMDSFLDIVANTLGLLVLISAMTVVTGRGIKIDLGTPLMSAPDAAATMVAVECRGGRFFPLDDERFFREEMVWPSRLYQPVEGAVGFSAHTDDAEFTRWVSRLDPARHWLFFVTRPNSFEEVRKARQSLQELGFDSGWLPWSSDRPISFGPSGRSVTID